MSDDINPLVILNEQMQVLVRYAPQILAAVLLLSRISSRISWPVS